MDAFSNKRLRRENDEDGKEKSANGIGYGPFWMNPNQNGGNQNPNALNEITNDMQQRRPYVDVVMVVTVAMAMTVIVAMTMTVAVIVPMPMSMPMQRHGHEYVYNKTATCHNRHDFSIDWHRIPDLHHVIAKSVKNDKVAHHQIRRELTRSTASITNQPVKAQIMATERSAPKISAR